MAAELELLQALADSLLTVAEQKKEMYHHKLICKECEWDILNDTVDPRFPCWRYEEIKYLIDVHKITADAHLHVWKEDYGTKARQT